MRSPHWAARLAAIDPIVYIRAMPRTGEEEVATMAKYCLYPGPHGEAEEFPLGDYPGAEEDCRRTGGEVVDREGICVATASTDTMNSGSPGSSSISAAALRPIEMLRKEIPESDLLRDLETVNYSPALRRIIDENASVRSRINELVGIVSQFAVVVLVDPHAETLERSHYTEELHSWLLELADTVRELTDDEQLREALGRLVSAFDQWVGESISAMVAAALGTDSPTST